MSKKDEKEKSIVRIEISLPEAVKAIQNFKKNRVMALGDFSNELKKSAQQFFETLMETEFSAFLGRDEQSGNKRNGYRERTYALKGVGALRLRVPRDRHSKFDSSVIPKNEVMDPRLKEDFAVLSLAGISMRSLGMISRRILGLEVGKDTVAASYGLIEEAALKWLERPLEGKYWALYMDGTNFKVQRRGSTEREPTLVVLGVGEDDCRSILAMEPGHKENVECWRTVFKSLKSRGLDAGAVRIGVMDGLPGLEKAFREEFPNAVAARCWVHAKRNAVNKCPARLRDIFRVMVSAVMYADSQQGGREAFLDLKAKMGEDGKRAVHCLEKDLESLLIHYTFDRKYWRALKTTNPIERVNKEFKRRAKPMEGMGEKALTGLMVFTALKLEMGWQFWKVDDERYNKSLALSPQNRGHNLLEKSVEQLLQ